MAAPQLTRTSGSTLQN